MGFDQLCVAFGEEVTNSTLLPSLVTLLKDNEQEVRTEAVKAIEACLVVKPPQINSDQFHTHFFPLLDQLRADPAQPVRGALAALIGPVTQLLGRDRIEKELLILISDLMKDESHHVRLGIVSHVGLISEVLGLESLVQHLRHSFFQVSAIPSTPYARPPWGSSERSLKPLGQVGLLIISFRSCWQSSLKSQAMPLVSPHFTYSHRSFW